MMKGKKISQFNVVKFVGEEVYVYNTLTSAFIKLTATIWNSLPELRDKELFSVLLQQGILVKEDTNEVYKYKYFFYSKIFNKKVLSVTIAPTMQCNFCCPYCFEENHKNFSQMSKEVEDSIVDYLAKQSETKSISICWFGGEPLLAFNKILSISSKLDERGVKYNANMITNGSLLTEEVIRQLETLHLTHVQISMDGVEEEHDKKRHYKNGKPSFGQICSNIETFLKLTKIKLALHVGVDNSNPNSYRNVYFYMRDRFPKAIADGQLVIRANCIKDRTGFDSNKTCFSKKQLYEKDIKELTNPIYDKFTPGLPLLSSPCMYRIPMVLAIDSKGYMYHCLEQMGQPTLSVGNILSGKASLMQLSNMTFGEDPFDDEECLHCNVLPVCGGGCPLDRKKLHGEKEKSYCSYYKNYLADLLPFIYNKNTK